ncbi:hypothetical protein BOO91_13255 [Vibrio navarrensis]|uniref:Sugar ABC transporter ATPase n=1 Tax=Vibrio navarrensis TaxID=29495 RepID=A0AAJ4LWH6_9VIBR|nr:MULTISPECIES: sugar ABC transporter ATPase [Vibrio]KJR35572.1 sugar ABC transporter ATPase [Vibrio sp. S234-5]MBE3652436.1 hypothetical protein [Vibrio navarrensis]MBE3657825.1 hypothetical protein [Vibrio navarrensis]MBE3661899.1 hypothetical protein [Vibrio navarrensis]MBE3668589.1 hypothetical protein [Vibrio navarrensis]
MKTISLLLIMLFSISLRAADVLVIESYHNQYEWDKSYLQGLRSEVADKAEIVTFEMDTKRLPREQYPLMAEKAFATYQQLKPKIVVLGDDNALNYMLPKLYDEPISLIFLGININPRKLLATYHGKAEVTGLLELPLFVKNIGEIKRIIGKRDLKVWILFDSGVTSEISASYIDSQYQLMKKSLSVDVKIHLIGEFQAWQSTIDSARSERVDAIIVGLYQTITDSAGRNVSSEEVIAWTNQHTRVPLFGFWDFSVGKGKTSGGVVLFGDAQGKQVGQIVNQILLGTPASTIPIQIGNQGRALFSEAEMKRWGLQAPNHAEWVE